MSTVVMNIGTGKFFLHQTAEELQKLGLLDSVICGWLIPRERRLLRFLLLGNKKTRQLLNRSQNLSNRAEIVVAFSGELFWQFGVLLSRSRFTQSMSKKWLLRSFKSFDTIACKHLIRARKRGATIYHFRSGFGGRSVKLASSLGMMTICDHSTVHPKFDFGVVDRNWDPNAGENSLNRAMLQDIDGAGQIIVNSQFVRETFKLCSYLRDPFVLTPPLDPIFVAAITSSPMFERRGVVFVGKCGYGKGIDIVAAVAEYLEPQILLTIIGNWDPEALSYRDIMKKRANTNIIQYSSPETIAQILSKSLIFLFPTRAEGSARVVGEALHCACVVMTTKESGVSLSDSNSYLIGHMTPLEVARIINALEAIPEAGAEKAVRGRAFILELEKRYMPSLLEVYELQGV